MLNNIFFRNSSWAFIGNIIYALSQWGILVVLAKVGSTIMVGQFTLGLAITAPIILFTNLQLRNVIATDVKGNYEFGVYFGLRLLAAFIAYTIILITIVLTDYDREDSIVILAVGLIKIIESLSDIFYGVFQRHEMFMRISLSKIIKGPSSLIALTIILYFSNNVFLGVLSLAVVWGIVLSVYDIPYGRRTLNGYGDKTLNSSKIKTLTPNLKISLLRNLAWMTLPLGFVEMLASFNINTPRYFIESKIGISELGIYSSLSYFMVAGGTIVYSLGQAAMPKLAFHFNNNNRNEFFKLFIVLMSFCMVIGVFGIVIAFFWGEPLLSFIYNKEYSYHNDTFVAIMIASLLNYTATILWFCIASAWKFKIQIFIFGGALIVNIFSCFLLIPSNGIIGGAIAFSFAELFRVIISLIIVLWIFKNGFNISHIDKIILPQHQTIK